MSRVTKGDVLVLVHRNELKEQHNALIKSLGIANVRISTYQTEIKRLGKYATPKLLVVDEGHLSRSNNWQKVIEYYDTFTVGFTATPIRLDGKPLGDIFDVLIEGVDVRWLIDNHRLAPYEYYAPTTVDTTDLRKVAGDYVVSDLEQIMNERAIYGNVIESYRRFANGERTICYCVSVEHARNTAHAFNSVGIKAECLSAGTPTKQRKKILEDFKRGLFPILCNCTLLSEGISIDEVTCCMLLRPTDSIALGIQQMMRCMRYLPDKTAKILDFVGNYTRIGLPDEKREWSLERPITRKKSLDDNGNFYIRCCPECFLTFATAPRCPYCGAEYPLSPREIKAHEEIELQKITAEETARINDMKKAARIEQGRAQSFEELLRLGRSRNYKNPAAWAARVMRGRRK
jgi:superfamily II DNA or RNA helicase